MRIKKIKVTSDNKVYVAFEKRSVTKIWDEYTFSCSEAPRPELLTALSKLAPHVIEMCELPESYLDKIDVRSVSFSYGGVDEVMGATITSQMKLENSYTNLNLNTPHKASDSYSDAPADEKQLLTHDCIRDLDQLCEEVELYINGDRAQGKLFAVS
jgi:hypothetical protein